MKLSRGAIALYVGLVFVCGGVVGVFGNRLYTVSTTTNPTATKTPPNPEEWVKNAEAEYKRRLSLTDAQALNLKLIHDETRAKTMAEIKGQRERSRPVFEKITQEQIERINAMLTPEQRAEYEKMRQERQEKRQKNKEKGSGHNGPGF